VGWEQRERQSPRNERKKRYATKDQPLHIGLSSMVYWLSFDHCWSAIRIGRSTALHHMGPFNNRNFLEGGARKLSCIVGLVALPTHFSMRLDSAFYRFFVIAARFVCEAP